MGAEVAALSHPSKHQHCQNPGGVQRDEMQLGKDKKQAGGFSIPEGGHLCPLLRAHGGLCVHAPQQQREETFPEKQSGP